MHTILIHGLCQAKRFKEVNSLFVSMCKSGLQPNMVTYTALLKGALMSNMVANVVSLIDLMNQNSMLYNNDDLGIGFRNDTVEFGCFSYSVIIDQLCKAGMFKEAKSAFQYTITNVSPLNVVVFNCMLTGLCKEGSTTEALKILSPFSYMA